MRVILKRKELNNLLSALLFLLLTVGMYFFAPNYYSKTFCSVLLLVYVFISYKIISLTTYNNNYITFHTLFLISFLFVNFIYPIFIYPLDPFYFSVFRRTFDVSVISKSTALSLVAVSSYYVGVVLIRERDEKPEMISKDVLLEIKKILTYIYIFCISLFLYFMGSRVLNGDFGVTSMIPPGLLVITQVCINLIVLISFNIYNLSNNFSSFLYSFPKDVLLLSILFVLLFLYTGDRGPAIQLVLIFLVAFSLYVKNINAKTLLAIALFGMLNLSFVQGARTKDVIAVGGGGVTNFVSRGINNFEINNFWDIGMDLIVSNYPLYAGYDYVNEEGYLYGSNMFTYLFAPLPLVPSLMSSLLFDSSPSELTTANLITKRANSTYGLGTNMVIDIYMAFGFVGVVIFMFFLGFVITFVQVNAFINKFKFVIVHGLLISFSIYLPRASMFDPLRHVIWALFLFLLIFLVIRNSKKGSNEIFDAN